jgi:hypothetical protein
LDYPAAVHFALYSISRWSGHNFKRAYTEFVEQLAVHASLREELLEVGYPAAGIVTISEPYKMQVPGGIKFSTPASP